jgi:hypothetical protein
LKEAAKFKTKESGLLACFNLEKKFKGSLILVNYVFSQLQKNN